MEDNLIMYVNDRTELVIPIREIMRKITKYIHNKDKTTPKYEKKMNELKLYIENTSRLRYRNYINEYQYSEENIFNVPITNGCNMLMMCCIYKIDEDFCIHIIKTYGELFELGEINEQDETALIISIKNNMFDVAAALLDYRYDPFEYDYPNSGQLDKYKKNAMDYMLEKINYDEDGNIDSKNNDIIIENIDIISELLRFHLNELYEEPHNNLSQSYINLFCENRDFWRPLLEEDFENDKRIDFKPTDNEHTNNVCDNILKAIPPYTKADVISTRPIDYLKRTYDEIDMPNATDVQQIENQETEIQEDGRVIKKVPLILDYGANGGKTNRNKSNRNKSNRNKSNRNKSKKKTSRSNKKKTVSTKNKNQKNQKTPKSSRL